MNCTHLVLRTLLQKLKADPAPHALLQVARNPAASKQIFMLTLPLEVGRPDRVTLEISPVLRHKGDVFIKVGFKCFLLAVDGLQDVVELGDKRPKGAGSCHKK
jgi:hypothetical protein